MKVFAISAKKEFYRIGESNDNSNWYTVTAEVEDSIKEIQKGDLVELKYKSMPDGTRHLGYIKKIGSMPKDNHGLEYMRPKTPEERADIHAQAVGHMTSRSLKGINGITIENCEETIRKLYKLYTEITAI